MEKSIGKWIVFNLKCLLPITDEYVSCLITLQCHSRNFTVNSFDWNRMLFSEHKWNKLPHVTESKLQKRSMLHWMESFWRCKDFQVNSGIDEAKAEGKTHDKGISVMAEVWIWRTRTTAKLYNKFHNASTRVIQNFHYQSDNW